jgi:hypothetical protein
MRSVSSSDNSIRVIYKEHLCIRPVIKNRTFLRQNKDTHEIDLRRRFVKNTVERLGKAPTSELVEALRKQIGFPHFQTLSYDTQMKTVSRDCKHWKFSQNGGLWTSETKPVGIKWQSKRSWSESLNLGLIASIVVIIFSLGIGFSEILVLINTTAVDTQALAAYLSMMSQFLPTILLIAGMSFMLIVAIDRLVHRSLALVNFFKK